ncbi:hypothetical protein [Paenibacillus wynnii]|uniref:hypothetical protein n=1 Tax=Paenibacillus wynnii TaxID=268407 RepID=UPI0027942924|nr:hypothetical protein [Paenibacillus wynnii]MDQ0195025.1 hypothetical protein [Paenibacillus wynnii]
MMKDPYKNEVERVEMERKEEYHTTDSSIVASNAIKYTAYVILFFGFLYFLVQYILPML